jgi:hypothetical protein
VIFKLEFLQSSIHHTTINRSTHQLHEMRSLMMHRIVVEQFQQDPTKIIEFGLNNLQRWREKGVSCDDFEIREEILRFSPLKPRIDNSII